MSNFKYPIGTYLILVVFVVLVFILAQGARAFTMQNPNYILQMGEFNTAAGTSKDSKTKLGITVGQTGPGLYSGTNYKVRLGFQYIRSIIRFAFSISETLIDFGTLSPTNPVTRTNLLTVSNGSANGYTVVGSENRELKDDTTDLTIPDTTCDDGTCTELTGAAWTSTLTYGFGYRCDNVTGSDCASGFSDSTFYKQFANKGKNASEAAIMTGKNAGRNKKTKITYKVNISGTQAAGTYSNVITFIATPTF